jgi:hypothetical protein
MPDRSHLGGWVHDPAAVQAVLSSLPSPFFATAAPVLAGSGAGKTVLLYRAWFDVCGSYVPYPAQQIGDCVSHGFGHGTDLLACVQICLGKRSEAFIQTATEAIYGMARVDVGGGQIPANQDGAVGAWAAKAVSTLGTVNRDVVGEYSGERARAWGAKGCPPDIDKLAPEHIVKTVSMVNNYAELEDALANGFPVPVCSNQGFSPARDKQGFCSPQGTWAHCMLLCGCRTDRPGACILNSWGQDTPSGPLDLDQPPGSFWADRSVVEKMLQVKDSFSLSSFDGYPQQDLPASWSTSGWY